MCENCQMIKELKRLAEISGQLSECADITAQAISEQENYIIVESFKMLDYLRGIFSEQEKKIHHLLMNLSGSSSHEHKEKEFENNSNKDLN